MLCSTEYEYRDFHWEEMLPCNGGKYIFELKSFVYTGTVSGVYVKSAIGKSMRQKVDS